MERETRNAKKLGTIKPRTKSYYTHFGCRYGPVCNRCDNWINAVTYFLSLGLLQYVLKGRSIVLLEGKRARMLVRSMLYGILEYST